MTAQAKIAPHSAQQSRQYRKSEVKSFAFADLNFRPMSENRILDKIFDLSISGR